MSIAKIIGIVTALALMVGITAYTEANATSLTQPVADAVSPAAAQPSWNAEDIDEGWEDFDADIRDNKTDLRDTAVAPVPSSAPSANTGIFGTTPPRRTTINGIGYDQNIMYSARTTASGMIGQAVTDLSGKKIATVKDIVLDSTGSAVLLVVTDGGFMGMGDKLAALDYKMVVQQRSEGDVMMPMNAKGLDRMAPFSYDVKEASEKVRVIPANGYSTVQLLKGKILDPKNKALGDVENIVFRGGKASQVVVEFDKKLNLGVGKAALDFNDMTIARHANGVADFRMNERQSADFEAYRNLKAN